MRNLATKWTSLGSCIWYLGLVGFVTVALGKGYQITRGALEKTKRPSIDELRALARKGVPIVTAIYRFKEDHGLWPCSLADLSPTYIAVDDREDWGMAWKPQGWWMIVSRAGFPDSAVRYQKGGNDDGWAVTDGINAKLLDIKQVIPGPGKLTARQKRTLREAELQRRIRREPMLYIHRQALVGHYYQQGQYKEARQECLACLRVCPVHWWPRVMLSRIDHKQGKKAKALADLTTWIERHKDFTHRLLLAEFLYERGDKKAARAALSEAAKYPLANLVGSEKVGEVLAWGATMFAWNGAMMAYNEGWYDEARAISVQWEVYNRKESFTHDSGHCAIRAACYLANSDFVKAGREAALARKRCGDSNFGWTMNFDLLEKAIKNKDAFYRYKPYGQPVPLPLLIDYQ